MKPLPQINDVDNETSLNFKEHRDFFEHLFQLRMSFIVKNYEFYMNVSEKNLNEVRGVLLALIAWTSPYLEQKLDIDNLRYTLIEKQKTKESYYEVFVNCFDKISKAHEECELLPKVQIQLEDKQKLFWKEETDASLKNLKKAFYDYFYLNED